MKTLRIVGRKALVEFYPTRKVKEKVVGGKKALIKEGRLQVRAKEFEGEKRQIKMILTPKEAFDLSLAIKNIPKFQPTEQKKSVTPIIHKLQTNNGESTSKISLSKYETENGRTGYKLTVAKNDTDTRIAVSFTDSDIPYLVAMLQRLAYDVMWRQYEVAEATDEVEPEEPVPVEEDEDVPVEEEPVIDDDEIPF